MDKRRKRFALGILILVLAIGFLFSNGAVLLNVFSGTGQSIIEVEASGDVTKEEIKVVISAQTDISVDDIKVKQDGNRMDFHTALLEPQVIAGVETALVTEFKDDVRIMGYQSIGKASISPMLYIVFAAWLLLIASGVLLIVKTLKSEIILEDT